MSLIFTTNVTDTFFIGIFVYVEIEEDRFNNEQPVCNKDFLIRDILVLRITLYYSDDFSSQNDPVLF